MLDYTTVLDIGELPAKAGTALGGTLGGLFHSSARAELAGLATGLLAPNAVHIGLDNMGVTQKLATILDCSVSRRRPWCLQPDGDLWQFVDSTILQRGINSSSCDWIKGHVTLRLLDQGYSTRDAIFNSFADAAADSAHRISTMKVQHDILSFFARKQQQMVGILAAIFKRIARVARAANDMLTTISKENAGDIDAPIFSYIP